VNLDLKPKTETRVVFDPLATNATDRGILLGLGRGLATKELAAELGKTHGTAKQQIFDLTVKSGMNRMQLSFLGARMLEAMAS
jgi:hypothetical protein